MPLRGPRRSFQYCHPLPIDSVDIEFAVDDDAVNVSATVEAIWKTGVEMEALTAASAAMLTIYDMLKPIDKELVIESVRLEEKRGGKTDFAKRVPRIYTAVVIVTSDSTHAGKREDRSGRIVVGELQQFGMKPETIVLPRRGGRHRK